MQKKPQSLFRDASYTRVIHYSCESFYDRPNGASPRITSIAVRNLDSAQTASLSINKIAEREGIPFSEITHHYDDLEKDLLNNLFAYSGGNRGINYIHWNMRDMTYGFAALEHRFTVLRGVPYVVDDHRKFDLSRMLIDIYGVKYIDHPRLANLLTKNNIKPRDFLPGEDEAKCFEDGNLVTLHQSTLRKVDVLANIA